MPVYQGVLKTISGGVGNTEGRWTVREFIDIGDTHLRNVYLTDYHDEVLKSAMGEEVAISIGGTRKLRQKKLVVAIRTPQHGVDRPTRRFLFGISAFLVLKHLILSPFVAAILLGVAAVAQFIADPLGIAALGLGILALVWWLVIPWVAAFRLFRAAGALSDLRPPLAQPSFSG